MTRLLFALVVTAAVLTFASACGGASDGIQTASPSAQAPSPAGTGATITFEGRRYTAEDAFMWFGRESLEPAGTLDPGDGRPPLQVYRFRGGPAGAILTQQPSPDGSGAWQYWAETAAAPDGGQSAPGAPPGSVPGAPPGEATPTLPDNAAPPPGDVISVTVSPAEGTATAPWATVGPGIPWPQPSPESSAAVEAARQALAQRLGVSTDAVQVVSVEFVQWPDGCLGLGEPNEPCIAMMIPGFRVTLTAGGVQYVYHTDAGGGRVRLEGAASPAAREAPPAAPTPGPPVG